jgi:hypothetical protein
VTL